MQSVGRTADADTVACPWRRANRPKAACPTSRVAFPCRHTAACRPCAQPAKACALLQARLPGYVQRFCGCQAAGLRHSAIDPPPLSEPAPGHVLHIAVAAHESSMIPAAAIDELEQAHCPITEPIHRTCRRPNIDHPQQSPKFIHFHLAQVEANSRLLKISCLSHKYGRWREAATRAAQSGRVLSCWRLVHPARISSRSRCSRIPGSANTLAA